MPKYVPEIDKHYQRLKTLSLMVISLKTYPYFVVTKYFRTDLARRVRKTENLWSQVKHFACIIKLYRVVTDVTMRYLLRLLNFAHDHAQLWPRLSKTARSGYTKPSATENISVYNKLFFPWTLFLQNVWDQRCLQRPQMLCGVESWRWFLKLGMLPFRGSNAISLRKHTIRLWS